MNIKNFFPSIILVFMTESAYSQLIPSGDVYIIKSIERHILSTGTCDSKGTDKYVWITLKNPTNSTETIVYIDEDLSAKEKDVLAIALSALATGMNVEITSSVTNNCYTYRKLASIKIKSN